MKQTIQILSCLIIGTVVVAQDDLSKVIGEIYGPSNNTSPFNNLVEVTTPKLGGIGALEKCGEGGDQGIHVCVPYFQCDPKTNTIKQDGSTDGFGKIDVRFGNNDCPHYLEVCCGLPPDTKPPTPSSPSPVVTPTSAPTTPPPTPSPVTPRPSSLYCGIRNPDGIDFKLINTRDREAEYGEFPWMVAILKTNPSKGEPLAICGGSLIAPNVVLTGAHCVADLKVNEYKVRAGEWDTQTEKERLPYQERSVSRAIIHEEYKPKVIYNNVALLILSSAFTLADNIGTICLPNQDAVFTSRNCLASGWGKDVFGAEGRRQVILKKIELPMVPFEACQDALRSTRLGQNFQLHKSFTCAGGEAGKDTCTGDGGSPLVCPDPRTPGRYLQAGIVSWGIGCGEKNIPGVYADVAKFRSWIDNKFSGSNLNSDPYKL